MPLGAVLVTPTVKYLEPHWATFLLQFEHGEVLRCFWFLFLTNSRRIRMA
jgi:hypothetical protein